MNSYSDNASIEAKEEIRSRLDIAQVVGRYVKLKPAGQNLKGLCPFHKEKSPSFTVNPSKAVYHCFGCGKGGDIFAFLMDIEGLTFPEALQRLAEETGVALRKTPPSSEKTEFIISKTDAMRIHAVAVQFYYEQMKKNETAITYFKSRHLKAETVKYFQLGYASDDWSKFYEYAKSKKITQQQLIACGLAVSSSKGGAAYDRFRGRIIFPIFDISGKPIALAGRSMEPKAMPKYLNSPETILYRKNRVLYGLHASRESIKEKGFVFFVEGYMDFLSLFQNGITNVVATSGTALTEEHAHLIQRFCSKIILVFDGDSAGFTAAERGVFTLAPQNLDVRVLLMPEGEDPDTFVIANGGDAFLKKISETFESVQFLLNRAMRIHDSSTAVGKSAIVDFMLPLVAATADPIVQASYIKKIAEQLDLQEQLVYTALSRKKMQASETAQPRQRNHAERYLETEEGSFIHMLVKEPSLVPLAQKHISAETFTDFYTKNLYSIIIEAYTNKIPLENMLGRTDNEVIGAVISLMLIKEIGTRNQQEEISHKVKRFILKCTKKRIHEITQLLRTEQDQTIKKLLLTEHKMLSTQRGELTKGW